MNSKQLNLGNKTENKVSNLFSKKGYWNLILPKSLNGQPFDIIACKDGVTWFVDAKHLEANKASFTFDRIEPNQELSMRFSREFAYIKKMGFVIEWERDNSKLFFLSYDKFIELKQNGAKSVKISDLTAFEEEI